MGREKGARWQVIQVDHIPRWREQHLGRSWGWKEFGEVNELKQCYSVNKAWTVEEGKVRMAGDDLLSQQGPEHSEQWQGL